MKQQIDVVAVGNAVMDIVRACDDSFLGELRIPKGCTTLVPSPAYIDYAKKRLKPGTEISGGSAANVAGGIASLGGTAAFIGSVADDSYGKGFRHDIRGLGVSFDTPTDKAPGHLTSHSLVLTTPDGQRTMLTYLGNDKGFLSNYVCADTIRSGRLTYVEGYLFDRPDASLLLQKVTRLTKSAGARLAFCLPDSLCIMRNRLSILNYINSSVDILFANEREIAALYGVCNLEEVIKRVGRSVRLAVLTQSERGSIIVQDGRCERVQAEEVPFVKDMTGAGDLFAAGFIYAMLYGAKLNAAARLGSFAAAEIITVIGARPEVRLKHLARLRGLFEEVGCVSAGV